MKNKLMKIFTAFFIISMIISILPLTNIVEATIVTFPVGFEGSVVNTQYWANFSGLTVKTQRKTGTFNCTNIKYRSGVAGAQRSFIIGASTGAGWLNLTYSNAIFLTNFSFYINSMTPTTNGFTISFCNKTSCLGNPNKYMMRYYINWATNNIYYYNSANTSTLIRTLTLKDDSFTDYGFIQILDALGDVRYNAKMSATGTVDGTAWDTVGISTGKRIDAIYLANTGNQPNYIDDLNFTFSSSYTMGAGGITQHDFSIYNTLGSYPTSYTQGTGALVCTDHEQLYNQYFSGKIYGADIFNFNGYDSSYKTNWNLGLNGMTYLPTESYNISIGGVPQMCHVYRYDFVNTPLTITNEKILIEMYNPFKIIPNLHSGDIDGDGLTEMKYGSQTGCNNVYDGSYLTFVFEFDYVLYYLGSAGAPPENNTVFDVLDISGQRGINGTDNSKLFYKNDTVLMSYGVKDSTVSHKIIVKCGATYINYSGFPKQLYENKGSVGFRANKTANYTVKLVSNNIVTVTKYFDVINNPYGDNYQVSSQPPLSYDFTSYYVYYRYFNPVGYMGYLGVYTKLSDMVNQSDIINKGLSPLRQITSNTSSSFLFIHSQRDTNHYWQLFSLVNGFYYPVGDTHIHYIQNTLSYNYITTSSKKVYVKENFTVWGSNTVVGGTVWIYINGVQWKDVSGMNTFNIQYSPNKALPLVFSLYWVLSNGTKILLAISDQVLVQEKTEGGGNVGGFSLSIPAPFSYFVGIFIIIAFIIIPIAIAKNFNFANSQITGFISIGTGVTGFILTILLGYFPAWSVAVFIIIMVVIIVVMWLQRKVGGV